MCRSYTEPGMDNGNCREVSHIRGRSVNQPVPHVKHVTTVRWLQAAHFLCGAGSQLARVSEAGSLGRQISVVYWTTRRITQKPDNVPKSERSASGWVTDTTPVLGYRHHVGVAAKSVVKSATGTVEGPSSCSPTTASIPPSGGSTPVRPSCCWGRRLPFDSASKP